MGRFVNPDNSAFQVALNSDIYVDKTYMIEEINKVLDTINAYICNSRPRRFGKSYAANMLAAYYSKGCDSQNMFSTLAIGKASDFMQHLNKYDVIHIDIQWFLSNARDVDGIVAYITDSVLEELRLIYPEQVTVNVISLPDALSRIKEATGQKFIVIIDEWDVLIRDESTNIHIQNEYISFLRGMFKGTEPTKYIQLAYLTGILPIKREKTQSALNNFDEYTMLGAGKLAPYIGFTENEVKELCERYNVDFQEVCHWYDGYTLGNYHIYNPKAVISVIQQGEFKSYWSQTSTFESIRSFINMDFDGLKTSIIDMLSGAGASVNPLTFQNDMIDLKCKDDVLTLLIHLGYLAYNPVNKMAFIPNEEVRQEFVYVTNDKGWSELLQFGRKSAELLDATLDMEADIVAAKIDEIHTEYVSVIAYNNEISLSSVITIAYLSSMEYYFKPVRELPTGRGFADFVYIPKPEYANSYPALVVELKWNKSAITAIKQIKERDYPKSLIQYTGDILLVGINYDKEHKKHDCVIEEYKKN